MEKQLQQFMDNVKAYCKRILMLVVSASFACAALITANGEAAKNVLPFKQVALSECTQEEQGYAFGDIRHDDYLTIQNHMLVEEALLAAASVEPEDAGIEEKTTAVVAQSYQTNGVTVSPVYADPSMNGYECLGTFLTTGYCSCAKCCGKSNGVTACGVIATANHTIAADTSVLPFGTQVVINGKVYTVEDRGGAIRGNRIDIYFATHQEALNYGKRYVKVYRYVGTSENASSVVVETMSQTPDIETTTTTGSGSAMEPVTEADTSTSTESTEHSQASTSTSDNTTTEEPGTVSDQTTEQPDTAGTTEGNP